MTDEELDGYLVLIHFVLKKEKSLPSKNSARYWIREIFEKKAVYGIHNNFVHELRIGDRELCFKYVFRMTFLLRFPN